MYDEAALKVILQRAMELDASKAATVTPDEVVQIATELGISEAAVREALREREGLQSTSDVSEEPARQMSVLRILGLSGGAGVLAGILTSGAVGPTLGMVIVGAGILPALVMVSGGLALTDRSRSLLSYLRRNTAMWLGFGISWSVWSQLFPLQNVGGVGSARMAVLRIAMVFVLTTGVGLALLVVKRTIGASRLGGGSGSSSAGMFRRIAFRVRKAIQELLAPRTKRVSVARLDGHRDAHSSVVT
jgi:hypothetical protein